jgi:hypothetical protein
MSTRRTAIRLRAPAMPGRVAPAYVGVLAGVVLVVSVFLPWYATNLGPPFSAVSASGWDATIVARLALAAGVVVLVASAALALEERGALPLSIQQGDALARGVVAVGILATILIAVRFVWMPDPAEFLSRQIGLYLAGAAAICATLAGLAQVASRD